MPSHYRTGSRLREKLTQSPEATSSINRGQALTKPLAATPRPDFTPEPTRQVPPQARPPDPDIGLTRQPQPGRLPLGGKSFTEQARLLGDFLKRFGTSRKLTVGGTSQYDAEINRLLDRVNDPNTQEGELSALARQISDLAGLREGAAKDADFVYDPATGQYVNAPAGSGFDRDKLTGIIDDYLKGTGSREQENLERARLSDEVLGGARARKQSLADRLSASGVHGGAALDVLGDVDRDVEQNLASGLRDISLGSLERRGSERDKALGALTDLAGLESRERLGQGELDLGELRLDLERELGRDEADRLWAELDLESLQDLTGRRGQDMGLLSDLLALYSRSEGEDRALLLELIQGLI